MNRQDTRYKLRARLQLEVVDDDIGDEARVLRRLSKGDDLASLDPAEARALDRLVETAS